MNTQLLSMRHWAAVCVLALLAMANRSAWADDAPAPLTPQETPSKITVPPGFQTTLFAGEPDVVQPINMTIDDRGRLWVVESFAYPGWKGEGKDRIIILEDRDGDGKFDERKVFFDHGMNLTSAVAGFGGVWALSVPNLLFFPDADGDDVPDGEPTVLLDGWNIKEAGHNAVNNLNWGPDGWLYGLNGIQSRSQVGKPGAAENDRVKFDCGMWRYHPTKHVFEVVCRGTTNPFGLDFDEYGQAFFTNCVIAHLWHAIPGAHYERMYGQDVHDALMETCADHLHWVGHWTASRGNKPEQDSVGGGHSHVGAMIYLGDNFPASYRNHLFTCNLHGHRVNQDILKQRGSGYVASHGPDFLSVADSWFRGISLLYGPDGGVFVSDWTDTGECHNYKVVDQSNGRIYKVTYGQLNRPTEDLAKLSDDQLVERVQHRNAYHVRHATRLLQERAAAGKLAPTVRPALEKQLADGADAPAQLRAIWALHVTGGLDDATIERLLVSKHPYVRIWAIQLETEDGAVASDRLTKLAQMAQRDPSPAVRMALASALQRLPVADRWQLLPGLLRHVEDVADKNLSLMIWYGVEPVVPADPVRALDLTADGALPILRYFAARRAAAIDPGAGAGLAMVVQAVGKLNDAGRQVDFLDGAFKALSGQRRVAMPAGWSETHAKLLASKDRRVRSAARRLAILFGDESALAAERSTVIDRSATPDNRREAIEVLAQAKDAELPARLFEVLSEGDVALPALRALAGYDDPATPAKILEHYHELSPENKSAAIGALTSRPAFAEALLAAIETNSVPRGDLAAYHVQQLLALKNDKIKARLEEVWGASRATPADKQALTEKYKRELTSDVLAKADLSQGRGVFVRNCANCHTLFGAGGKIGPDLTGSQRSNLDYVLSNIVDPSAVVARDYQITLVQTSDGRTIAGVIKQEDDKSVTLQTATEVIVTPKNEIETRQKTTSSIMPDGLLAKLTEAEVRNLVAYLAGRDQVPAPEEHGGLTSPAQDAPPPGAAAPGAAVEEKK